MISRSRDVADGMSKGVTFLLKKNKIDLKKKTKDIMKKDKALQTILEEKDKLSKDLSSQNDYLRQQLQASQHKHTIDVQDHAKKIANLEAAGTLLSCKEGREEGGGQMTKFYTPAPDTEAVGGKRRRRHDSSTTPQNDVDMLVMKDGGLLIPSPAEIPMDHS